MATNHWIQKRRTALLWISYLLLAVFLTWPTAQQFTTHLPGDGGDDPAIAWNLWWVKQALLNQGQNPFHSDFMFYPIGINLAFYTLTVLNGLMAIPLLLNIGVVAASNLHLLFTFVVSGFGTFLLARYLLSTTYLHYTRKNLATISNSRIWLSAAIAGGFFVFAGNKLFYVALGQFNIASSHWVPFTVLYILKAHHHPHRLKNSLMAGLFLVLQSWTEMTYATFLMVFIGLYWLFWLFVTFIRQPAIPSRQTIVSHLKATLVLGGTFAIGVAPILAQILPDMLAEGDFLVEGSGFADSFSADLFGFLIPTKLHPFLGEIIFQTNIGNFTLGQHIYIGYIFLGLLITVLFTQYRHIPTVFWFIAAIIFALLTLGPVITINGQSTEISGPFIIFQYLPFFRGNRYPSRYSVMLILSLSVIAAIGLTQIARWTNRTWPLLLVATLFLVEHIAIPLPQSDMRIPDAYQIIAAAPDDAVVLDIPFAWRNGFRITGAFTTQFMFGQFYQTHHQKRLLQGNTSRNPEFKFQYFTNAPVINSLLALETGKPLPQTQREADRVIAADVLRFFNIKYIVVRPETNNPYGHYPQNTIPYIEEILPVTKIHDEPAIKIYQANRQTLQLTSDLLVDTHSPLAPLYFGEGWGLINPEMPVAAQRKSARLLLPLNSGPQRITIRMRLPEAISTKTRSVHLELNGWQSKPQQISTDWQDLTFEIPPNVTDAGLNNVILHFEAITSLSPVDINNPLVDITAISAGNEVGDFARIFVNGHDMSPNQRGYNIAIIKPGEGKIQTANFDTHLDAKASTALANFIRNGSPNSHIVIAAADEASDNLSEEAVQAIQTATGATGDLRGCHRCSHVIISKADSKNMVEGLEPLRPVGITTGLGLTEPNVAAIVDSIHVELIEK